MSAFRSTNVCFSICILLASFAPQATHADDPTPIQIDDLYRHDTAIDLVVMAGGRKAIYVRDWAAPDLKYRRSALWSSELAPDGESLIRRPMEPGEPDARRPVLSPDGQWIAFQSTRPLPDGTPAFPAVPVWSDPATDIWLIPAAGGSAIPLVGKGKPYGRVFADPFYARVSFSPDGRRLAFVADDGMERRTKEEQELGITVVRDDQGEGYEGFEPASIWVAELCDPPGGTAAASVRRLTKDGWYGDPQWTPDGKSLVVHANTTADQESVRFSINRNYDILRIDVESGELVRLTDGPGPQVSPRVSPDGRRVVCLSSPRKGPHSDVYNVELIELGGKPTSRILFDHHADSEAKPPHGSPSFPLALDCWLDSRWLAVDVPVGTRVEKQVIDADSPHGDADPRGPEKNEVLRSRRDGRSKLTPPSHDYLRDRLLGEDQVVRWKNDAGQEIEGVLTLPHPSIAMKPYRLLLHPHGGPHGRSVPGFNFTAQLFAGQGYAVFQPNFRGSTGYGRKFLDADRNDLGGGDMRDILTGIDHLVREGVVDPTRQFVYGVSYGGYMTSWLIGHTHQFRAAVPQNAVTDLNVMWGVGDLQSWAEWELGGKPWEVPDAMRKHSPFAYVDKVKTPTLILHADHDRRCPLAMGQMFYRGLKAAGVETEMVVYHNERHGIARLDRQADVYRRVLDWFERHDPVGKPKPSSVSAADDLKPVPGFLKLPSDAELLDDHEVAVRVRGEDLLVETGAALLSGARRGIDVARVDPDLERHIGDEDAPQVDRAVPGNGLAIKMCAGPDAEFATMHVLLPQERVPRRVALEPRQVEDHRELPLAGDSQAAFLRRWLVLVDASRPENLRGLPANLRDRVRLVRGRVVRQLAPVGERQQRVPPLRRDDARPIHSELNVVAELRARIRLPGIVSSAGNAQFARLARLARRSRGLFRSRTRGFRLRRDGSLGRRLAKQPSVGSQTGYGRHRRVRRSSVPSHRGTRTRPGSRTRATG